MSHPNSVGNGCSLEDCQTNLFALTDLAGIKWKKLVHDGNSLIGEPSEDPILISFARCIQSDVLCVWRRGQKSCDQNDQSNMLCGKKELWIFWYGDLPPNLNQLIAKELTVDYEGSWEETGLSYECRTLLFKALHNLIERCLLCQSFVRIGKWFVQPFDHLDHQNTPAHERSSHLSIKFSFFLHGESTVCASIDVRQHPPLWRLQSYHLTVAAQNSQQGIPVILAPYGLNGHLTGVSYKTGVQKCMDEWRQFYIVPEREHKEGESNHFPSLVEVVVADVRMKYPSSYVLVTADTETEIIRQHGGTTPVARPGSNNANITPPSSPVPGETAIKMMSSSGYGHGNYETCVGLDTAEDLGHRLACKVCQDGVVASGSQTSHTATRHQEAGSGTEETNTALGAWHFDEPTKKPGHCGCLKKQRQNKLVTQAQNKHIKTEKTDIKTEKQDKRRTAVAFHKRHTNPPQLPGGNAASDLIPHDADIQMNQYPPHAVGAFKNTPLPAQNTSIPAPMGGGTTAGNSAGFCGDGSLDSPHSAAPSPLANQIQPSVTQNGGEDTMPTLSPHPPAVGDNIKKEPGTGTTAVTPVDPPEGAATGNQGNSANPVIASVTDSSFINTTQDQKPDITAVKQPSPPIVQMARGADCAGKSWLDTQRHKFTNGMLLKRPGLPIKQYNDMDEELETKTLYNFESLDDWLNYPLKKNKLDTEALSPISDPGTDCKKEPMSPVTQLNHDPYAFSEESSTNMVSGGGFSKKRKNKDDSFNRQSPFGKDEDSKSGIYKDDGGMHDVGGMPGSLDYLTPNMGDLNHIFDTSEDESNDDNELRTHTPPASVPESTRMEEETVIIKTLNQQHDHHNIAEMYPTPPSMENNNPSPYDTITETHTLEQPVTVIQHCLDDKSTDWSFVYRPPIMAEYVKSEKYSPIELPSSNLTKQLKIDVEYRPSWQHFQILEKPPPHTPQQNIYGNMPGSVENLGSVGGPKSQQGGHSLEASPAFAGGTNPSSQQQRTPRTPMSYELQSPASNASSYMNKNSVDNQHTNSPNPEAHSLLVNIMLSDSVLNLFKDQNFDSCTICVCNENIKGADVGLYLPDRSGEAQFPCMCGFSAVVNRRHGYNSGLFYEDEVDITGMRSERLEQRKPSLLVLTEEEKLDPNRENLNKSEIVPPDIISLLQNQFSIVYPSYTVLKYSSKRTSALVPHRPDPINLLEIQDGCEACFGALDVGRQCMEHCTSNKIDEHLKGTCLHKWPYLQTTAKIPTNSEDAMRLLKSLQPLLQDAIQKKRTTRLWESVYTITGPLSWKDFHLLAGRGADERSEPQPIPPILVGYDKDWLSLAPHAVRHWDKFPLEPYGKQRDIAYLVVAPDNDFVLLKTKAFFEELCREYELLRLGRHRPLSKTIRDGVIRVGKKAANILSEKDVDKWFSAIGSSPVAENLRLYAQVCKHHVAPFIAASNLDKTIFEDVKEKVSPQPRPAATTSEPSPAPPHTPDPDRNGEDRGDGECSSQSREPITEMHEDQELLEQPAIVIYMIDPFTFAQEYDHWNRLSMLGLLRAYSDLIKDLPQNLHNSIQLQILPIQNIIEFNENASYQYLRNLALSVFTQCRRHASHSVVAKSLTGFGPAASGTEKIAKNEPGQAHTIRLYSPPFVVAPVRDLKPTLNYREQPPGVLLCAYCLSEDQRWLLATCTDNRGEVLETCTINIEIPNRNRRKKASARKIGLQKLWDFVLSVISVTTIPWRLVIGRFGRIGHGELKGWSGLLSQNNLLRTSKQLKEMCNMCGISGQSGIPCILSANLVSMEMHSDININLNAIKLEERQSSSLQMSTPRDASCTHILVMPTSATASANVSQNAQDNLPEPMEGEDDDDIFSNDIFSNEAVGDTGLDDINILEFDMDMPASPLPMGGGRQSPLQNGRVKPGGSGSLSDPQEEKADLHQQPLAMGFYVSSAKTGPLPHWMWSPCPHREDVIPVCFKAALHVHTKDVMHQDDPLHQSSKGKPHPLDSNFTCDVLRYVLETYNALSWLAMDPTTNDRRSCLPIHFLVLMQLYHAMNTFV